MQGAVQCSCNMLAPCNCSSRAFDFTTNAFAAAAEQYLREVWPAVTRALKEHGIACELNLVRPAVVAVVDPRRHPCCRMVAISMLLCMCALNIGSCCGRTSICCICPQTPSLSGLHAH
jgi:hypothetical protein